MSKVVVIGAGLMWLSAAYWASKHGHEVDVFEAAPDPGGMAGHFELDGVSIERFYHFVCRTDAPTFGLMRELGISDKLRWRDTSMGLFHESRLHTWGHPSALFRFPSLRLVDKLRYGIFAFVCVRRNSWAALENQSARTWITRWCGEETYNRLWKTLFDYKFYEYADSVSAAWIWTRIRRIGRSRKSMFQEELGLIEGGSRTLVDALIDKIQQQGGRIHLSCPVLSVLTDGGQVTGVRTPHVQFAADHVLSTVPTPLVSKIIPDLPQEWKDRYDAIPNIGVICVIFKLARSISPHFWINISEPEIEIPGVIQFTNLREIDGDTVMYVPYYMPVTNPKFTWTNEQLLEEAFDCLQRIQPKLVKEDIRATHVARLRHGQPVCAPGFAARIPPVQTPIAGLQVADTCYYYPEDRGIAESVRLGGSMAMTIGLAEKVTHTVLDPMSSPHPGILRYDFD
jgi:protoporphyrinogen oxidase